MRSLKRGAQKGSIFVEALIALVIFSVGILSLSGALILGYEATVQSGERTKDMLSLQSRVEQAMMARSLSQKNQNDPSQYKRFDAQGGSVTTTSADVTITIPGLFSPDKGTPFRVRVLEFRMGVGYNRFGTIVTPIFERLN